MAEDEQNLIASVQLSELELLSANPAYFTEPMQWRVRIDLLERLPRPVTMSFVWVGSARSDKHDQTLDEFEVGPLACGPNEFIVDHNAPDVDEIPREELLDIAGMYLMFSYAGQPFLRVAYCVKVAYWDEQLNLAPPRAPRTEMLGRNVLMQRPMMSTFYVDWQAFVAEQIAAGDNEDDEDDVK